MAPFHAPLRTIYPVQLLLSLLPSILNPAKRSWLGNSKTSLSLVLCCPLFRLKFFISWLIVQPLPVFGAPLNLLLPPHPTLGSCNCMALFRIFDKVMILSLSTCNAQKVNLMNWLRLADLFLSPISTYMCFGDFAVNFVIWLRVCQPKLILCRTLSFIVTCLLMNLFIAARYPPVYLLHPCCPPLHSPPQYMQPSMVFLGQTAVVQTDYVDEVTAEYLAVGDPESCCKKFENMLITGLLDEQLEVREGKSQLNFRLHALHHLALNTYTVLASAYKIRASDLFSLHSEVGGLPWEALSMSRISAAYSLLLATATYHLFCFESSLLVSVANFWTSAGESLLALAKSSAWDSLGKCGFPVLNLSPLAKHKCSKCSLLESFEVNLSFGQDHIRKAGFDSVSSRFLDCIGSLLQEVWGFLIQGDRYLKMFKDPTDFSWLGKSLDIWDFDAELTHNDVDFNCWTNKSVSGIEALGYTDQWRINTFQLGVHCLLYGGFLAGICYGPHSHWSSHIRSALNYEGK